jgi:UDP-4-amino-4,6-dideoxy-N-acetyl-beta-L-altrosamine N-acetyltransferase
VLIRKYDITLKRLTLDDIELVRYHRNREEIQQYMLYRENISPEMQLTWFNHINTMYHNYFLIEYHHQKIGLINGKNSDFENRTSEGGMFIWDVTFRDTLVPSLCSVILSDYNFIINEFEINYIQVLANNTKALAYNKLLGYTICHDKPSIDSMVWMSLHKADYLKRIGNIRKGIGALTGDATPLALTDISFQGICENDIIHLYSGLPTYIRDKVEVVLKNSAITVNW